MWMGKSLLVYVNCSNTHGNSFAFRYMNISLERTEEFVNGQLRRSYGEAFIRGNNGRQI